MSENYVMIFNILSVTVNIFYIEVEMVTCLCAYVAKVETLVAFAICWSFPVMNVLIPRDVMYSEGWFKSSRFPDVWRK
jgi:hypothetical protein